MRKEVYWPRVIEAKKEEPQDKRAHIQIEIKKFLLNIKPKEKQSMLEQVYLNNFIYAKNAEQMELLFNIIKAMEIVDRIYFVPRDYRAMAYFDTALPIGHEQTISQPSTVARMLLLLLDGIWVYAKEDKLTAYEIGTGSGWNACIISCLLGFYFNNYYVYSVDRIKALVELSLKNVKKLSEEFKAGFEFIKKLKFVFADGFEYAKHKKFDYIIFTAGIPNAMIEKQVKEMATKSLRQEGRLICPETYGEIFIYEKGRRELKVRKTQEAFAFVPLMKGKVLE